jgi:uncharacterized protein (TIGR03086 family)
MRKTSLVGLAVPPTVAVVRGIKPDLFDAPTPCAGWTVRDLIDHLLEWAPVLAAAGRKVPVTPGPATGDLEPLYDDLVAAWSDPVAWQGTTRMGGPNEFPAAMIGGMVLAEVMLHGWDLARATGQDIGWDGELVDIVHREVAATADFGREMGVYGPAVPVPDTAPALVRTLGLAGRDPHWTACP